MNSPRIISWAILASFVICAGCSKSSETKPNVIQVPTAGDNSALKEKEEALLAKEAALREKEQALLEKEQSLQQGVQQNSGDNQENQTVEAQRNPQPSQRLNRTTSRKETSNALSNSKGGSPLIGKIAPDINLKIIKGNRFRLSEHRSKNIVVLDFWTTWCGPCVEELPELSEILSEIEDQGVAFCAVNVEERRVRVLDFLRKIKLDASVVLDDEGETANDYLVKKFPTLVVIDKEGIVRSVHVGTSRNLSSTILKEVQALIAGKTIDSPSGYTVGDVAESSGDEIAVDSEGSLQGADISHYAHGSENFILNLSSGRTIDIGAVFREEGKAFEQDLQEVSAKNGFLRVNHEGGSVPFLLVGRKRSTLTGPTASYYANGAPSVYMNYQNAKRTETLFTWDETKRPMVFEQYSNGKKHGLRCLFKACCEQCKEGHIWLVQEWARGTLQKAHIVPGDGNPVTVEYVNGQPAQSAGDAQEDMDLALAELSEFEKDFDANEEELKKGVAEVNRRERKEIAQRKRQIRAQNRARQQAMMAQRMRGMASSMRSGMRAPRRMSFRSSGGG